MTTTVNRLIAARAKTYAKAVKVKAVSAAYDYDYAPILKANAEAVKTHLDQYRMEVGLPALEATADQIADYLADNQHTAIRAVVGKAPQIGPYTHLVLTERHAHEVDVDDLLRTLGQPLSDALKLTLQHECGYLVNTTQEVSFMYDSASLEIYALGTVTAYVNLADIDMAALEELAAPEQEVTTPTVFSLPHVKGYDTVTIRDNAVAITRHLLAYCEHTALLPALGLFADQLDPEAVASCLIEHYESVVGIQALQTPKALQTQPHYVLSRRGEHGYQVINLPIVINHLQAWLIEYYLPTQCVVMEVCSPEVRSPSDVPVVAVYPCDGDMTAAQLRRALHATILQGEVTMGRVPSALLDLPKYRRALCNAVSALYPESAKQHRPLRNLATAHSEAFSAAYYQFFAAR